MLFWPVVYLGQLFNPSYSFLDQLSQLGGQGSTLRWSYFVGQSEGKIKVDSEWL